MKLPPGGARPDLGGLWDDDVLALVVLLSAFALVLGLMTGCHLVTLVEVADDVGVQVLDCLLQR